MEKEQEIEWAKAQNIAVSVDLLEAAKKQLEFLAAVDRNRYLYESPAMEWAIYRYNAFWLPLLAKHSENAVSEDPLVVPFDCEWIWHCHRLNPVRYKSDCEERFGRILGNHNIISSVQGISKSRTEELWNKMYPEESYELDCNRSFPGDSLQKNVQNEKFTSYDLVSAAKRQVPFSFQVARPHMSDDLFLQEAVARYKGFLHLIRTNRKNNIKRFCVPTYDVDLIWHTHQLNPVSYCNDLLKLMGKVLEHDDTDSDRTKGKKLDTGFSDTTKQWEDTFGLRYWKAGAMYRGATPTPVTQLPIPFTYEAKKLHAPDICDNFIQFPEMKAIEVLLEFVEIKNLPEAHKGNIHVSFRKKQPDNLFSAKRTLSILSESGEKQVAYFQCEPTGEFLFELECHSPSYIPLPKSFKPFGSCSLSLQECVASGSQLTVNKWLPVVPLPGILASKPILLHVSLSCTLPTSAVQVFHLLWPQPFLKSSCYFPLPKIGKIKHAKSRTCITDDDGNDVLNLQMRESSKDMTRSTPGLLKEVHYITGSGETHSLAEFQGNGWLIKGTHGSFKLHNTSGNDGHLFELVGHKMVKLFAGRRLDFEPKHCKKQSSEHDFMTAVEFSAKYPYGRATALIDFKNGTFKVKDEWMILTGITLAFILSDILKRKGGFTAKVGSKENILNQVIQVITSPGNAENVIEAKVEEACGDIGIQGNSQSGGCGSGCGSGCGNMVQSGGCGSGCGSGCGNMVQSGGCGSGCGSGCGNMVQSGRCGSGCGSGCGNMVKSGGCGSECGSGCGNMVQSGGCGSGCGSGCGNMVQNGGGCGSGCGGGCKGFGGYGGVVKSGGCGGSGGCGSGCSGHNLLHNDNVGACDLPKVEASIVNEHVAA